MSFIAIAVEYVSFLYNSSFTLSFTLFLPRNLSKDDGNGNDNARKQRPDWLNEEK